MSVNTNSHNKNELNENVLSIIDTPIPTFNSIPEPTEINDIISDNKPHYKSIKKLNIEESVIEENTDVIYDTIPQPHNDNVNRHL